MCLSGGGRCSCAHCKSPFEASLNILQIIGTGNANTWAECLLLLCVSTATAVKQDNVNQPAEARAVFLLAALVLLQPSLLLLLTQKWQVIVTPPHSSVLAWNARGEVHWLRHQAGGWNKHKSKNKPLKSATSKQFKKQNKKTILYLSSNHTEAKEQGKYIFAIFFLTRIIIFTWKTFKSSHLLASLHLAARQDTK